jgi:hypothetical protein
VTKPARRRRQQHLRLPHVVDSTRLVEPWLRVVDDAFGTVELRGSLESYLKLSQVERLKPGESPPLAVMTIEDHRLKFPPIEYERYQSVKLQTFVDSLLRRVLDGEDPRTVFALDKTKRGLKGNTARQIAATAEVARLVAEGFDRVEMTALVAEFFGTTPRTVERWCAEWDDRKVNIAVYVRDLKTAGLL